jgi:hypothetical protein
MGYIGYIDTFQPKQSVNLSGYTFYGSINILQKKQVASISGTNFYGSVAVFQKKQATSISGTNFYGAVNTSQKKQSTNISAVMSPPAASTLVSPLNGATGVFRSLTFTWNSSAGAATYELQISTENTFTTGVVYDKSGIITTSQQVTGLSASTQYYWRVGATNGAGTTWSTSWPWNFTTGYVDFSAVVAGHPPNSPHEGDGSVQFGYTGAYTSITSYVWNYGDGSRASYIFNPPPSHVYPSSNVYSVSLTVSNGMYSDTIIKYNYIIINELQASSESIIIESFENSSSRDWKFYVDDMGHLSFDIGADTFRSTNPVVNLGVWTLVEFHPGRNKMYVASVGNGRKEVPCYLSTTGSTGMHMEDKIYIAENSNMKIDELKVTKKDLNLDSYFRSLQGTVYYLPK